MSNHFDNPTCLQARYQRAALLQQSASAIRDIALNTTPVPHWINDKQFWYRRQTHTGDQFRLVDCGATTNEPAFDHQTLARALTEITRQAVSADNLPIDQVVITLSPLQVCFVAFDTHYCFDADTQQCHTLPPVIGPKHS